MSPTADRTGRDSRPASRLASHCSGRNTSVCFSHSSCVQRLLGCATGDRRSARRGGFVSTRAERQRSTRQRRSSMCERSMTSHGSVCVCFRCVIRRSSFASETWMSSRCARMALDRTNREILTSSLAAHCEGTRCQMVATCSVGTLGTRPKDAAHTRALASLTAERRSSPAPSPEEARSTRAARVARTTHQAAA